MQDFSKLLNPSKIAVVGVSQDDRKVSSIIFNQLKNSDYSGEVIPVNPKYQNIGDSECFPSLNSIVNEVDIAVIVVPASAVINIFEELEIGKVKFAVIISGGFHQHGDVNMETQLVELAKQKQVRFIGPNSLGFIFPKNNLNLSFGPPTPQSGNVALVSQSGAVLTVVSDMAHDYDLGISQAYSIGDKVDLDENEILELLISDPDTEVIGGYLETIKDEARFINLVSSSNKPVIMLKPLESKAAKDFAEQHTGQVENSSIKDIYSKAGVIVVESVEDLFFTMLVNQWSPKLKGNKVGIISNTGGFAAITTDSLTKNGFEVSELSENSKNKVNEYFEGRFEPSNPMDILGDATSVEYAKGLDILNQDENLDAIVVILTPQSNTDVLYIAESVVNLKSEKPIVCIFMGGSHVKEGIDFLLRNKVPAFRFLEHGLQAVQGLKA